MLLIYLNSFVKATCRKANLKTQEELMIAIRLASIHSEFSYL